MYFWVNQGKTYKEEREGGYLWAPTQNEQGQTAFHWENMLKLRLTDVVFNYVKGYIVGYCVITSEAYKSPQPEEFEVDVHWENDGHMADADYIQFNQPLSIGDVYLRIAEFLPEKYAPITANRTLKANQGYLYQLNDDIGLAIFQMAHVEPEVLSDKDAAPTEDPLDYRMPDKTSRQGLVTSRVGQGEYRRRILRRWKNKCAVTGCAIEEILIASHIVPWRDSNNEERLDVENGILLSPVYDALFDRHLISFNDDGSIIFSSVLSTEKKGNLNLTGNERIDGLTAKNQTYLKRHRERLIHI